MDSDGIASEMEFDSGTARELRTRYIPELPPCLQGTTVHVEYATTAAAGSLDAITIYRSFPHTYGQPLAHFLRATAEVPDAQIITDHPVVRVGVVFCCEQSPGGHNVIWGLFEALKVHNPKSVLLGFLGGPEGLFAQKTLEISHEILSTYKNQGGYDLLGRTKDQFRTTEQVSAALNACKTLKLDALVIIGGVTSNTDAAQLAETFAENKCMTKVVGIPATLNGDLKNHFVETNVGFDTICKVNSQLISNVCINAFSEGKYYHFIRIMGRKTSQVALECTLQSLPNMVILAEEVDALKLTLFDITKQICDAVQARAEQDKYHGVILLPEGLIGSIPEVRDLLKEIQILLRQGVSADNISGQLSPWLSALFEFLPLLIRKQLLLHPESDDPAQLSQIETEKLLAHLVETEMNKRSKEGTYKGKFSAIYHFFGYQAPGSLPSKFDCDYAYVLGHVGYHIIAARLNGYMATVTNLKNPVNEWKCGAVPITVMMSVRRYGYKPSILGQPALYPATVDLKGKAYELLRQNATKLLMEDMYRKPGPLQFSGPIILDKKQAKGSEVRTFSRDIIERILTMLSSKDLVNFQCVIPEWLELIQDPLTIQNHLKISISQVRAQLLVITEYGGLETIRMEENVASTISLQDEVQVLSFLGSCDGLVVCRLSGDRGHMIAVINPSLQKFVIRRRKPYIVLCRRSRKFVSSWFGHHPYSDEYVLVLVDEGDSSFGFRVYTLSRRISDPLLSSSTHPVHGECEHTNKIGTLLNHRLHFAVRIRDAVSSRVRIMVYDFKEDGTIRTMSSPVNSATVLGVVEGFLSTLCFRDGMYEIWIKKSYEDEDSWMEFAKIPYFPGRHQKVIPVLFCENGIVVLKGDGSRIPMYSFGKDGSTTLLKARSHSRGGGIMYLDSLVSPCTLALEDEQEEGNVQD